MIREIASGYLGVLRVLAKAVALVAVCLASGACIVWPLWWIASSRPEAYTALFCAILGALLALIAGFAAFRMMKKDRAAFLVRLASVLTLIVGLASSIALVLAYQRAIALAVAVATFLAYGFLAFSLAPGIKKR